MDTYAVEPRTPGNDRRDDAEPVAPPEDMLVARAAEGDDGAFEILVRRHTAELLALARRILGRRAEAEDAVQDALVNAWRGLPEFRREASFRTWVFRIVTNRCLNILATRDVREAKRPLDDTPDVPSRDPAASPPRVAESSATARALAGALAGLTAEQRACWVLRELHDMSYDEIGDIVGIPESAVRGRLFRARRSLMEAMQEWR